MKYCLVVIKNEGLPFAITSMNVGSKWNKSEREGQITYDFTDMWNLKNKVIEQARQKQTHRYGELNDGC